MQKLTGKIKKGSGRGKKLGFPTANFELAQKIADGIYAGAVGPMELPALVFVGAAKTFGETKRLVEVYILDFDENVYGQELEVVLLKKLRENKKFDSVDKLVEQMKKDEKAAREYLIKNFPSP